MRSVRFVCAYVNLHGILCVYIESSVHKGFAAPVASLPEVAQNLSHSRRILLAMQTIELYRWRVTDPATGSRYTTRHLMTEADAKATDPAAELVPGTREVRPVLEDPFEASTSAWQRPQG